MDNMSVTENLGDAAVDITPPTRPTQDDFVDVTKSVPPMSDLEVTNNIVNRLRRLTTRVQQTNRWAEIALDKANASITTPLPPINTLTEGVPRTKKTPKEISNGIYAEQKPSTVPTGTPPRLQAPFVENIPRSPAVPHRHSQYLYVSANVDAYQEYKPAQSNIESRASYQDVETFRAWFNKPSQRERHEEYIRNPPTKESSEASYLTPNWGNMSRSHISAMNRHPPVPFEDMLQKQQNKEMMIPASQASDQLYPYLDTLEVEPYLRMTSLIAKGRGSNNQLHKLAVFLREKILQRWREAYRVSGQREIHIDNDKCVSFIFKSRLEGDAKSIEKFYRVVDSGKIIEISQAKDKKLLERYVIGESDIPKKHIMRYRYLRDGLRSIRSSIPRAFVAYGHSGLAAILGSCRFPGINVELCMCPRSVVNEADAGCDSTLGIPLDSYLANPASVLRLWSIIITAPEDPDVKTAQVDVSKGNPTGYHSNSSANDSNSSGVQSDTYIMTPSPLYLGAKSLYRQWESSSKRGSSRRLSTPYHSAYTRPSSAASGTYLQSFLEKWPLTPRISTCRLHLVLERSSNLNTHDVLYDQANTITIIFSLSEALLWESSDVYIQTPKCHTKSSYFRNNQEDEQALRTLIDDGSVYWSLNCALNILSSNLELLSNLTDRDAAAIDTFHKSIAVMSKNGPVDGMQLRKVYSKTFPILSVLMPNTSSSPTPSPSASYTDDENLYT